MGTDKTYTFPTSGTFSNTFTGAPSRENLQSAIAEVVAALKVPPREIHEPPTVVPVWLFENLADAGVICEHCGKGLPATSCGRTRCSDC